MLISIVIGKRIDMPTVDEKIETVKSRLVSGNLLAVLWITVGTAAC